MIRDQRGTAAIEFALAAPAFLALLVGVMMLALLLFSAVSLENTVQRAARCAAILGKPCSNPASPYEGFTDPPVFTFEWRLCGLLVTARTSFTLDILVMSQEVPLEARVCA